MDITKGDIVHVYQDYYLHKKDNKDVKIYGYMSTGQFIKKCGLVVRVNKKSYTIYMKDDTKSENFDFFKIPKKQVTKEILVGRRPIYTDKSKSPVTFYNPLKVL